MSSYYSDDVIEEVRANNDITEVISEYIRLEKKGKDYFGLCPFHKEKTPSFSIVPGKQIFYCFGCGKGGNVIHFVMLAENLEFIDAVKTLAERAKIQLPEAGDEEQRNKNRQKQTIIKINTQAARYYYSLLIGQDGKEAVEYLNKRGLTANTCRKFGLGYSTSDWDTLHKHLISQGFSENDIISSGLVIVGKNNKTYDRFRNRIIFPIFDLRGSVIGLGGRVLDASMPKYMNSPETVVYNKGRNLYGLNFARKSENKRIIIVEGYMDVLSLHQNGFPNSVAALGTALTESQGRLLKKYTDEVIIGFDADTAGQAATQRGLDLMAELGFDVRVLVVPEGKDPDEFIKKNGTNAFLGLVNRAYSLVDYKLEMLRQRLGTETEQDKVVFLKQASELLKKIGSSVELDIHVKRLAKEYNVNETSILREIKDRSEASKKVESKRPVSIKVNMRNEKKSIQGLEKSERMLLALLCMDNSVFHYANSRIGNYEKFCDANKNVAEIVIKRLSEGGEINIAELLNIVNENDIGEFTNMIQSECNFDDNQKALLDILDRIEIGRLEKIRLFLTEKISEGQEGDVEVYKTELKKVINFINKIKMR